MSAGQPTITDYLAQLRAEVAGLPDADSIVDEAADHLYSTVDALVAGGATVAEAERAALARYGAARTVGRAFGREHDRGGAVATRFTRRAGLAAIVLAVVVASGDVVDWLPHSAGVSGLMTATGVVCFLVVLRGIRMRHGRLGGWGRAATWVLLGSMLSVFLLSGFIMLGISLALVLAGVGMLRAGILPPPAIALLMFGPVVLLPFRVGTELAWVDTLGDLVAGAGYAWMGWAMWREPALDEVTPEGRVNA